MKPQTVLLFSLYKMGQIILFFTLANQYNGVTYNISSSIYHWDGDQFNKIQAVETNSACDWKAFTIGTDTFLAVANYYDNYSYNIDSIIYRLEWE